MEHVCEGGAQDLITGPAFYKIGGEYILQAVCFFKSLLQCRRQTGLPGCKDIGMRVTIGIQPPVSDADIHM